MQKRKEVTERKDFGSRLVALPSRPGVYIMRNAKAEVIYVGKAANLKTRVRNYFGAPHSLELKTRLLVEQIDDFEYIVTQNAQEALHLEASLVKRHQPFFNVRLKDDKHYPYLRVDVQNPWPRVEIARRVGNDGARYFGPYASASSVRRTLGVVKKLFPWRSCTKTITGTDARPCLDYFINRCIAPCTAYCTEEEYDEVIRQTILFLEGRTGEVVKSLRLQMETASEGLQFEQAAKFRDQIDSVQNVAEKQIVERIRPTDEDVFGLARNPTSSEAASEEACVQVFFIRGTQMVGRDFFTLDGVREESDAEVLASFLKQFYESAVYVPKSVVVPFAVPEASLISEWLSGKRGSRVNVVVAQRGTRRRMVELASENARESLDMLHVRWLSDTVKRDEALTELQEELDLPGYPRRIECYDISNTQGTNSVASMVVFLDGQPQPREYRRFRIKTVEGANDFASMAEVLTRRFKRWDGSNGDRGEVLDAVAEAAPAAFPATADDEPSAEENEGADGLGWGALPDLVIVDGGKGQLSAALDVMRNLNLKVVPLAGLAKQNEELFVQDVAEPIVLARASQALYLVQRIRDEAHRFAIQYHRKVRSKAGMGSALDSVAGVGPKRKKALLRKFGSIKAIREASTEEVASTVGFTLSLASKVKEAL